MEFLTHNNHFTKNLSVDQDVDLTSGGSTGFTSNNSLGFSQMGDHVGVGNGTIVNVDDISQNIDIIAGSTTSIGDLNGYAGNNKIIIDSGAGLIEIVASTIVLNGGYVQLLNQPNLSSLGTDSSGNIIAGSIGIVRSIISTATSLTANSAADTDFIYLVSGTTTITMPTAVANTNQYTIKNIGTNTVTIATTSSQTIDGSTTITLPRQYSSVTLISNNSNWFII